ncbi:MAG: hypothetical protein U0836_18075 [Pirellulales bacterium]
MDCEYERRCDGFACRWCGRAARSLGRRNCLASRGLGDSVARVLARFGVHARPGCGCGRRRAWLNRLWPYRPGPRGE